MGERFGGRGCGRFGDGAGRHGCSLVQMHADGAPFLAPLVRAMNAR